MIYYESLPNIVNDEFTSKTGTYRLYNSKTNKSYIGVTMTKSFYSRWFCGIYSHYHNIINRSPYDSWYKDFYDVTLTDIYFQILSIGQDLEEHYIKYYDSFNNGYNRTLNGKSGIYGLVAVTDGIRYTYLKPDEVEQFIKLNPTYKPGNGRTCPKTLTTNFTIRVNNGLVNHSIHIDDLDEFLLLNPDYKLGAIGNYDGSRGQIWITNGIDNKRIYPEDLINYPSYHRGRICK